MKGIINRRMSERSGAYRGRTDDLSDAIGALYTPDNYRDELMPRTKIKSFVFENYMEAFSGISIGAEVFFIWLIPPHTFTTFSNPFAFSREAAVTDRFPLAQ